MVDSRLQYNHTSLHLDALVLSDMLQTLRGLP